MKAMKRVEQGSLKEINWNFSVGDTVKVSVKVREGNKERTQVFQGLVIGHRGGGIQETIVVRKISANVAVERILPLHSPRILDIELVRPGRVRRAQLTGKRARVSEHRAASKAAAEALAASSKKPAEPTPEPVAATEGDE